MRLEVTSLYVVMVFKSTMAILLSDLGTLAEEEASSGDVDEGRKEIFRDLICFECSGGTCPTRHYHEPLEHLITSCQACYKEWDTDHQYSTRKCFFPTDLTELDHFNISTETGMCGVIERNRKLSFYCFCYIDYCNQSSKIYPSTPGLTLVLILNYTFTFLMLARARPLTMWDT